MRRRFDKAYYDRFYRDPRTRAVSPAGSRRQAEFAAAYLKHLTIPVRRILDVGCGVGTTLRALGRAFPRATTQGVEVSPYLCERYGWQQSSVADLTAHTAFDLVVCNDVLAYLDDRECSRALANLARLCRGALLLGVLTAEDRDGYDRARTDHRQHLRPAAWYRRRLSRHFVNVGGGLHLRRPLPIVVWTLDRV